MWSAKVRVRLAVRFRQKLCRGLELGLGLWVRVKVRVRFMVTVQCR